MTKTFSDGDDGRDDGRGDDDVRMPVLLPSGY